MPVNYSKFDNIVDSDDEKEKEEADQTDEPQKHSDLFPSTAMTAEDTAKAGSKSGTTEEATEAETDFVADARYGDIDDVRAALAAGVRVDVRDHAGNGALLLASANGHMDVVKCLLEAKASTEVGNPAGNTPLHWAALNGKLDICKALLEAKANTNARNEFKRRPFDEAFGRTHTDICELLATKTDFNADAPPATADAEADAAGQDDAPEDTSDSAAKDVAKQIELGKKAESKTDSKQAPPKKEAKTEARQDVKEDDATKARKDLLKKVLKEGGKRGVEIEGAADMGGLQFFCTSVDVPQGDVEMLLESMKAMNAVSDPTEEERKGGSGHVGKMIFSAGADQLAVVAYVPEAKQGELSCEEWLKAVLDTQGGKVLSVGKDLCSGSVLADANNNVFPLKIREPMILEANNFLRKRGLFPVDNDDDDDYVFGDDDFPS